jgi:glyoxylase-like metal-dependent hydrolase (beta-lactamase superfamily II)
VYLNASDQELYDSIDEQARWVGIPTPEKTSIDVNAADGATVHLGATPMTLMHTPGHTQGSLCVWIPSERKLVAGDTLFRDSVGRTDLPGGDHGKLLRSIHEKVFELPDDTLVIPGHGRATTIGREKAFNPFLQDL